jgi:hypothetical protein
MTLKAQLLDRCGRTQKGWSVAVRAMSIAKRAKNLSVMYAAMGAVSKCLVEFRECDAAWKLMDSVMPQVSWISFLLSPLFTRGFSGPSSNSSIVRYINARMHI